MNLSPLTTDRSATSGMETLRATSGFNLWVALAIFSVAGFVYTYAKPTVQLIHYWNRAEYGHGYIIPFIALLLAWHDLVENRPQPASSWRGVPLLVIGFLCLVIGQFSTFNAIAIYGLILGLVGLSDAFLGRQSTWILRPAFIYLLFAVPLPDFLYVNLSAKMQLISSTLGVWMLDIFSIPVFQDGNVIDLGGLKLQVVEACSGLRYLFPLASFGFLAAYLLRDAFWKRTIVFLSTVPITIILNAARIAVIGITSDIWGREMAEGFIHTFEGWVVFLICVGVLMLEIAALRMIGPGPSAFRFDYLGPAAGPLLATKPQLQKPGWVAAALVAAFALITAFDVVNLRVQAPPPHLDLSMSIPPRIGGLLARRQSLDDDTLGMLNLTDYYIADYAGDGSSPSVNLYVGYWANQSVGSAAHSPANCIPGGGWYIADKREVEIPEMQVGGRPLKVNRLLIKRGDVEQLVYYWFNQRGRDLTNEWSVKYYLLHDQVALGRSDGFLMRLVTPVLPDEGEGADRRLRRFISDSNGSLVFDLNH